MGALAPPAARAADDVVCLKNSLPPHGTVHGKTITLSAENEPLILPSGTSLTCYATGSIQLLPGTRIDGDFTGLIVKEADGEVPIALPHRDQSVASTSSETTSTAASAKPAADHQAGRCGMGGGIAGVGLALGLALGRRRRAGLPG